MNQYKYFLFAIQNCTNAPNRKPSGICGLLVVTPLSCYRWTLLAGYNTLFQISVSFKHQVINLNKETYNFSTLVSTESLLYFNNTLTSGGDGFESMKSPEPRLGLVQNWWEISHITADVLYILYCDILLKYTKNASTNFDGKASDSITERATMPPHSPRPLASTVTEPHCVQYDTVWT